MTQRLAIDLFTDIVCPWCYIGTERLEKVLLGLGPEFEVTLTHHPFFLNRNVPEEGFLVAEDLRRKYGRDPAQMFKVVEGAARESGMALDLTKQPRSYPTAKAHTLVRHAEPRGSQRALIRALFRAYFDEAKNIADVSTLAAIAEPHGFGADEVVALLGDSSELEKTRGLAEDASQSGIQGVPFFIFAERLAVSGAQPEAVLRSAIDRALSLPPA